MYCIKCGVELAGTEERCPLCQTRVFHPDIVREAGEPLYPQGRMPSRMGRSHLPQIMMTAAFVLSALIVLLCDLRVSRAVTWSGYVIGALLVGYVTLVLPAWFQKPNPVIFAPCSFAAAVLYLLYLNGMTNGDWFLSFAFPTAGGIGIIMTAVIALLYYIRRGKLFIIGGALIALGGFMLLVEVLINDTFGLTRFIGWSLYPLVSLVLLGGLLIFLGICRPARETMERKFFI